MLYSPEPRQRKPKAPGKPMAGVKEKWPMWQRSYIGFHRQLSSENEEIRKWNEEHPDKAIEFEEERAFESLEAQNKLIEEAQQEAMKAYENQLREQEKEKGAKKMMRKIMSPLTVFSSVMSTSVFAGAIGEMVFALRYFLRRTWFLSLLAAPMWAITAVFASIGSWLLMVGGAIAILAAVIIGFMSNSSSGGTENACTWSGCDVAYVAQGDSIVMSMYTKDGYYMPIGIPAEGHITQYEGSQWAFYLTLGLSQGHNGVDIAGDIGTPLYALGNGFAVYSYNGHSDPSYISSWYGCLAKVAYPGLDGEITNCYYAHMQPEVCASKDIGKAYPVGMFSEVGKRGNTGASTGPHLHYECRKESSTYSLKTSQFLGFSIPGHDMDESKFPTVSLGIPATADTGIAAVKKDLGGGWPTTAIEKHMGEWYNYLSSLSVVKEQHIDPLRIMALLYRERTSLLLGSSVSATWPSPYQWNPFQIGTFAAWSQRWEVAGCDSEEFGNFANELECYLKVTEGKSDVTQVSDQADGASPLSSDVSPYYFGQYLFAYNGTLESPYWQSMFCDGSYNQNIAYGNGDTQWVRYTKRDCWRSASRYNAKLASRDFWYSSYVMNKLGYAWYNMPFRGHGTDWKPGAMAFYFLLLSWKAEDFTPPQPVASGGWGQVDWASFSNAIK